MEPAFKKMNILLTRAARRKWNKTCFETLAAAQQIANETKAACLPLSSARPSRRWPSSLRQQS